MGSYLVLQPLRTKKAEYKAGDIIQTSNDEVIKLLLLNGTVKPLKDVFDTLWRQHAQKLKQHSLTADEIKEKYPDLYQQIQRTIEILDKAWLNMDLQGFREAMARVESLYFSCFTGNTKLVGGN